MADQLTRREFLHRVSGAAAGLAAAGALGDIDIPAVLAGPRRPSPALARRKLGRTSQRSSMVAFGGIAVVGLEQAEADRVVAEAIGRGVNHFDVAPTYGNGEAEQKLGHALVGKRNSIFLACKTTERSKQGAAAELRSSLKRIGADHFDLYQLHGLNELAELDRALGPDGAMEAFLEARQAGLVRYIGITGHRPKTLLEAIKRFPFNSVMVPVNFVLEYQRGYSRELLAELKRRRIGALAIKPIAARRWKPGETQTYPNCWYRPLDDDRQIELAIRFTLSQPVTATIPSGDARLVKKAIAAGERYAPLDFEERAELDRLAAGLSPILS